MPTAELANLAVNYDLNRAMTHLIYARTNVSDETDLALINAAIKAVEKISEFNPNTIGGIGWPE